ncbi:ribose-5-phosphate isomerase RpiA [Paenibacillus sediminis]|uniref:Ribose-5-phosphate isomerase A n=1 Tax=Paenibacillus sediminis TaxID=664909 RepID=A0ABS4H292_9BACL|nr:ribose-5-phosphate isomerase RpiA [Paenibacillus sediminis]MBP1936492.1 ribose 5-phosphate isomerase A [Paenibacillus sediminis]
MNLKQIAAEKAVEWIKDGMTIGLGTGSTAFFAIQKIGELVKAGLQVKAVPTSGSTEQLAREFGIPLTTFAEAGKLDITIDGADEVDSQFNLIKGGGGALLREKIVAAHSKTFIVVVDESKLVPTLGTFPLPVEVIPFAYEWTMEEINERLQADFKPRMKDGQKFVTDNGNYILDYSFGTIPSPTDVQEKLNCLTGVVEHGLFIDMADIVIVGRADGTVDVLERS